MTCACAGMANNISVESAASLSSLIAAAICNSRAAAAAVPEAEQRSVVEFTDSLQRLFETFRHASSAGIPFMAAEAARSSDFQARFESARTIIEQLCEDLLQAAKEAERKHEQLTATADRSPESSDADGRSPRGSYTPRRSIEELLLAILPWARASIDLIRARGSMFHLSDNLDKAVALNREALDDLGHLLGASEHPACTRPQVEQLLQLMHKDLRMYSSKSGYDTHLAADAWILHQSWRESYTRACNQKRYQARRDSQQELDADSAAEAATPAPVAEAATPAAEAATPATLATAVAIHAGSGAGKTLGHAVVAPLQSSLAAVADAGTPQSLPAAAAVPQSPGSESDYSYSSNSPSSHSSYSSYSDDVEAAPCKQPATATAVDTGCAHGFGRASRAGRPLNFMRRAKHARRAAGKAVMTASRSASIGSLIPEVLDNEGAAAAAESLLTSAFATAAVEQGLSVPPMDPALQAAGPKLQKAKPKSTAQKTAASAAAAALQNAAAAAAPSAPRAKTTKKKPATSAASQNKSPYLLKVAEFLMDPDFCLDLLKPARFGAASRAASAAVAAAKGSLAVAIDEKSGCSKCRYSPAGCRECKIPK